MRKKINQSEPLPITIEPSKIDKGVRDYLVYEDYDIAERLEVKDLLDIMLSDHPSDKSARTGENFLPTKKMKLTINKQNVIQHNIVPKAWEVFITDSMEWDFNKDYVTRGDLAIMDLLKNNQWKRPIYFVKIPSSELLGLDNYLVNEGLLYKLMPVDLAKTSKRSNNEDIQYTNRWALYDNLMQKYTWGNIKKLNYLDPLTKNIIPQFTNNFNVLARELLDTNQNEEARKVANKCLEVLPRQILTMNQSVDFYYLSDTLYEVNENGKANDLMKRNGDYITEQLKYKLAVAKDKPHNVDQQSIRLGMGILNAMLDNSKKYKQAQVQKYLENKYAVLEKEMAMITY